LTHAQNEPTHAYASADMLVDGVRGFDHSRNVQGVHPHGRLTHGKS
jgi:hypothetical protein